MHFVFATIFWHLKIRKQVHAFLSKNNLVNFRENLVRDRPYMYDKKKKSSEKGMRSPERKKCYKQLCYVTPFDFAKLNAFRDFVIFENSFKSQHT